MGMGNRLGSVGIDCVAHGNAGQNRKADNKQVFPQFPQQMEKFGTGVGSTDCGPLVEQREN